MALDEAGVQLIAQGVAGYIGDLQKAAAAETSMGDASQAAAQKIAKHSQAIDDLTGKIGLQKKQFDILTQELLKANTQYGAGSIQAQKKDLALQTLAQSILKNERALQGEKTALDAEQKALTETANVTETATKETDQLGKEVVQTSTQVEQAGGHFSAFKEIVTGVLREIGTQLVQFGVQAAKSIAGFVKESVGLAGDFEAGMNEFRAVAGQDVDAKGLEAFRDLFINLGKELPVSTSEVEQAATEMVKGGIDPATIAAGGLRQNIQFAAAAMGGDLVEAANVSAKILGGWSDINATASDKAAFLAHATDQLTKAANASSVDVHELSLGIFNAQGIAKTAGVSFDDLTTTLAALSPRFASSSEAGNSLKNVIARLQPTTKPAIAAMKGLGLITAEGANRFYDAQGSFVGFEQASQILQDSLKGLTDQQKQAVLQTIFGNDAMNAASGLAELGADGYQKMADALANANGVADNAALKQQGFNTALENAKGSVEALQITIGTALLPVITDLLTNYIAPGVNSVTSFAEAFFKMVPAIQASDDPLQTFLNALKIAAPGLLDVISAVEDFKDAITPAIEEVMRLADAFSQGGLGGLIDAVVNDIEAALPDIEAALLEWGKAFVDWIIDITPDVQEQLADWGEAFIDWIIDATPAMFQALDDLLGEAQAWIQKEAPGWGKALVVWGGELAAWIPPAIPPALAELNKLGVEFVNWIAAQAAPLLKRLDDWATSFVAWIPGATVEFLKEWPKMLDQFLDWVGSAAGPLLKQLGDWALSFIQWIAPMIPPFLVALGGIALAIGTFVIETAAVLSKKIVEVWVPAILKWIATDAIPGLVKALDNFLKVFDGWIKDAQRQLALWMTDVGKAIVEGIKSGLSFAWGSLTSWITDHMQQTVDAAKKALGISSPSQVMADLVGTPIIQGIMQGMQTAAPGMLQNVAMIGTQIVTQFKDTDLVDGLASLGEDVMEGFGAGMKAGLRPIKTLINSTADTVEGAFRDAFGAHSPATLMIPIGDSVVVGIIQGMSDALPGLIGVATHVATNMIGALTKNIEEGTKKLDQQLQDIVSMIEDIGDQIQAAIADSFGATASVDRQMASNLAKLSKMEDEFYKEAATRQLQAAADQAKAFADPKVGAEYYKMRSKQIFEFMDLQKQINAETNIDLKASLQQQQRLILAAQQAEIDQFNAEQAGASSPTQDIAAQLSAILSNSNIPLPGLLENPVIAQVVHLLDQLRNPQTPPISTGSIGASGTTYTNTSTTNLNMPVYTNQSPQVMQQSMAVAMAGLL